MTTVTTVRFACNTYIARVLRWLVRVIPTDYYTSHRTTGHLIRLLLYRLDYLNNVFSENNCSADFVRRNTHSNTESNTQTNVNSGSVTTAATIPYIRGTSETTTLQYTCCTQTDNHFTKTYWRQIGWQIGSRLYKIKCCRLLTFVKPAENLSKRLTEHNRTARKWWRQQSHCWAPFTDGTPNRLGLCDMYSVF